MINFLDYFCNRFNCGFCIILINLLLIPHTSKANDYYWIGGTGNWSDINHWSSSSGGTVIYSTPPSAFDNVYFDENSFYAENQTIYVDIEDAVCKDLVWNNVLYSPELKDTNSINLRIFGSLILNNQMKYNYGNNIIFESTDDGNIIKTNGITVLNNVFFDGVGGKWELEDNLNVAGNIYLTNGSLISNDYDITCGSFHSNNTNNRELIIGTSTITILNTWSINASNLDLDIDESVFIIGNSLKNYNGSNLEYYKVVFNNSSGSILNSNNYVYYDTILFSSVGAVNGNCSIDYLVIDSGGTVAGNDTIKYLNFGLPAQSSIIGNSIIDTAIFGSGAEISGANNILYTNISGSAGITGNNKIQHAYIDGSAAIDGTNELQYAEINGSAAIGGTNGLHYVEISGSAEINGNNEIQQITVAGKASIINNNKIGNIFIDDTAYILNTNSFDSLFLNRMVYFNGANFAENAMLNCDGSFHGENSFDTLTFTPGHQYTFAQGKTQTINYQWNIDGTCDAPIFLRSSVNGLSAGINKLNGPITGTHLSIRDISAWGNTPFTVTESVDLGNNLNWNISEMSPRNLYWVNGSGNWDDAGHWDEESNGPGGSCPPTELDNVFFNQHSFNGAYQSVTINTRNAVCNDMDWTGSNSPVFTGPDTNFLKIYGSLSFIENMTLEFQGETHFEATKLGKEIKTSQKVFNNDVKYQGIGGGWSLIDEFAVNDSIIQNHGTLNTKGNNINCKWFLINKNNFKQLDLNSDTVFLWGEGIAWQIEGENLVFDGDSSVIIAYLGSVHSQNDEKLKYHNVHFYGENPELSSDVYCNYNIVTFNSSIGYIINDCTIDSAIFNCENGYIYGNDTIKTVMFYTAATGLLTGDNIVEIAYFFGDGAIDGSNIVDTALFYMDGWITDKNIIDTTIILSNTYIEGENIIRTATLNGNGNFHGNNQFTDLFLSPSKEYIFGHESIQTIVDTIRANGLCSGPIYIKSDKDDQEAMIEKLNKGPVIEYAYIKDIKAIGPEIPFIAHNSIDLGNNSNWEINEPEPKALYWVGDSGNWSDSLHWASESGGEGGYCLPSPYDDVFFDHNSFSAPSTVYIDLNFANCRNMDWSGALHKPTFSNIPSSILDIYGSLRLIDTASLNFNYDGELHFKSMSLGNIIASAGQTFSKSIWFDGREGGWTLVDSLTVTDAIHHLHGYFNTNGENLRTGSYISSDTEEREIHLDTSRIHIESQWIVNAEDLLLDADSSIFYSNGTISSFNGDFLQYNDIFFLEGGSLNHESIFCYYDDVISFGTGNITGNCKIDTVIFEDGGSISGNDSINFVHLFTGNIGSGSSIINSVLFDSTGNVSGNNAIYYLIFNLDGTISGENTIDTTIIQGNGTISGENVLNSSVQIFGDASISGDNMFMGSVQISKDAYINGANIFESNVMIMKNGNIVGTNSLAGDLIIEEYANILVSNNINNALLNGSGYFAGSNYFKILTLTPGNIYSLEPNSIQTINEVFNVRGNNCYFITLQSNSTTNQQAYIHVSNGSVSGDFINMSRIVASGDAEFYAGGHSVNEGFNENWIWENAPEYIYGFGNDPIFFCHEDIYVLTTENFNGSSNTIYEWGDGTISPTLEVDGPGSYPINVYYSITPDTCKIQDTAYVELHDIPEISLGADSEICEGELFEITSAENYSHFLWHDGSEESYIEITNSGVYWVEITDFNGCKNTDSVNISALETPEVDLGNDTVIHNHEFIILDAGNQGGSFEWSTGESTQAIEVQGIEGGNLFWVIVEQNTCFGTDSIVIDEFPFCTVDVPTAFTPNGDGLNDEFFVYGSSIEKLDFKVFNRYGALVFETNDPDLGWDGNYEGVKQEKDVFTYYLKAICYDGSITEIKGNITLLK